MSGEESVINAAAVPAEPAVPPASGVAQRLWPYETRTTWRPWPALGAVVLIMTTSVAIGFGLAVLLGLAGAVSMWRGDTMGGGPLLAMAVTQACWVIGCLGAARRGGRLIDGLALQAPVGGLKSYALSFLAMIALVAVYSGLATYGFSHDSSADMGPAAEMMRGRWWPLALLVIGIGAPLSEELIFRGFLQTALVKTRLGYWGAAGVTTTLWAALHAGYSLVGLAEVFMIGLLLALILRRTGSLRVTLFCHAAYNSALALAMIFLPKEFLGF